MRDVKIRAALAGLCAVLAGCAADDAGLGGGDDGDFVDAGPGGCFSSNECPTGFTCNEFGQCEAPPSGDAGPAPPPPEVERELSQPSSALRYLYVAMAELDAIAKIDGATLAITSIDVGDRPGLVVSIPGHDDALVVDRGSDTVTIVRPTVDRDEKVTLSTLPRLNAVDVDAGGRFALLWFDLTRAVADAGGLQNVGEIGSFQDVTVVALERGEEAAADLAVGFRPREIEFDAAGTRAYVVTDDGVSVIDLAAAAAGELHVAATIPIAASPTSDPALMEVSITPDGSWALVREAGRAELRLVAVGAGAGEPPGSAHTIPLPAEATDVDLAADGTHAWAVLREASMLAIVDLTDRSVELVDLGGARVGSAVVDEASGRALLYTNAFYEEELVVVDLVAPAHPVDVWPLQKGVRLVALAPGGGAALVLHTRLPGDPFESGSVDELVDRSFGYSLVDLSSGFAKLAITPVDPGAFAFAPAGEQAWLALDGGDAEGAVARLQVIDLRTFVVKDVELGSPPEAVGILPSAGQAFVSQRHALGRVTFVDFASAATRTVTGFELGSHIVD